MKYKIVPNFLSSADIEAIKLGVSETINVVPNPLLAVESIENRERVEWQDAKVVDDDADNKYGVLSTNRKCRTAGLWSLISPNRFRKINKNLREMVAENWNDIAFEGKMSEVRAGILTIVYKRGDRFNWHHDLPLKAPFHPSIVNRRVSFSIIIQNAERGGTLRFQEWPRLKLQPGDLIMFDPRSRHRVVEVRKGTRISLVGWWYKEDKQEVKVVSNATN